MQATGERPASWQQRMVGPSAAQAMLIQERANERMMAMQAEMAEVMRRQTEYLLCKHALGFCVRHNRSPKPMRRLKHSLTMRWLESIPVIVWPNKGIADDAGT